MVKVGNGQVVKGRQERGGRRGGQRNTEEEGVREHPGPGPSIPALFLCLPPRSSVSSAFLPSLPCACAGRAGIVPAREWIVPASFRAEGTGFPSTRMPRHFTGNPFFPARNPTPTCWNGFQRTSRTFRHPWDAPRTLRSTPRDPRNATPIARNKAARTHGPPGTVAALPFPVPRPGWKVPKGKGPKGQSPSAPARVPSLALWPFATWPFPPSVPPVPPWCTAGLHVPGAAPPHSGHRATGSRPERS